MSHYHSGDLRIKKKNNKQNKQKKVEDEVLRSVAE